jgi:hypothetical protein
LGEVFFKSRVCQNALAKVWKVTGISCLLEQESSGWDREGVMGKGKMEILVHSLTIFIKPTIHRVSTMGTNKFVVIGVIGLGI